MANNVALITYSDLPFLRARRRGPALRRGDCGLAGAGAESIVTPETEKRHKGAQGLFREGLRARRDCKLRSSRPRDDPKASHKC